MPHENRPHEESTLSFFFGGALGALADAAMDAMKNELSHDDPHQLTFYSAIFGTAAKMVTADGVIIDSELETVRQFITDTLQLEPSWERFALTLFEQALHSTVPAEHYLEQFSDTIHHNEEISESFVNFLVAVALSDGQLAQDEMDILNAAERILELPAGTVSAIVGQYGWNSDSCIRLTDHTDTLKRSYALLEIPENATIDAIEMAFRKKTTEFSPQLASHKGLPAEFVKFADNRFKEICHAYTTILNTINN